MDRNESKKIALSDTEQDFEMAKRKSRKKSTLTAKQRFRLIVLVILLTVVGAAAFLEHTGIVTFDDVMINAGLKDKPAEHADTEVHFIDVGQGDCTLVISDGEAMVIDSGDRDETNKAVDYLVSQGIVDIKYLIVTHPHADHIGEMSEIIERFNVEKFIMPKVPDDIVPTTKIYENMLLSLKNKGIKITKATDCELELGSCKVQLFTPKNKSSNLNNCSTLVKVVHGDNSFLITGDCEKEEEKDILSQDFDISAKVLKAAHHGSSTSSSAEFLDAVMPRYAVISCGEGNKYGHPHEQTVTRLGKYADKIYVTMNCGTVIFRSDGEGLSVETEKNTE